MALLAEQLVDEWLNRQGFFTLRGLKRGNAEIDLLGVRMHNGAMEGWHVEVQVSLRPVGYLGVLRDEQRAALGVKSRNSAKRRQQDMLAGPISDWVEKKFSCDMKRAMREARWPGLKWSYHLVHGAAKEPLEFELIAGHGVRLVPLREVLRDLCRKVAPGQLTSAAGTDIAELIRYYAEHQSNERATHECVADTRQVSAARARSGARR